jgi:hypothetical protein
MDARVPIALADFPVQPKCSAWREGARKVGERDLHAAGDDRNVAASPGHDAVAVDDVAFRNLGKQLLEQLLR